MKGVIFTEFLCLVEEKFGLEMVDKIISESNLPSNGAYTTIGNYSFSEMISLLRQLNEKTGISIDNLLLLFGEHFFSAIEKSYPDILAAYKDPIEMLSSIESHIHVEVKKIYPDEEFPLFIVLEKSEDCLIMIYKSSRAMHHFGLGLMNKTFEYFNATASIELKKIKEDGTEVKFIIKKNKLKV